MCMWICLKSQPCINRAMSTERCDLLKEIASASEERLYVFQAWLFNTHFRGGLSAYGILAGWVCFPWDARGQLQGIPGKKWKTNSVKCFALSFQFSTIRIKQPGHRPQLHLEPSTVQYQPLTPCSCYKNTAVQTHFRLYKTADCQWKMSIFLHGSNSNAGSTAVFNTMFVAETRVS